MKILPDCWETDRLLVRDATMGDVPYLVNMFDACSYLGEWDNSYYDETEEAFIQLVSKSAGYNHHSKDIFKMQCVTPIGGDSLIGYYHLFHDSPLPRKVWISMFVVHPHFQKMHYGTELAYGILKQIKQLNDYEAIWIKVCLKNWPTLRFWIEMGWQTIIHYEGDTVLADSTSASVVLEKKVM